MNSPDNPSIGQVGEVAKQLLPQIDEIMKPIHERLNELLQGLIGEHCPVGSVAEIEALREVVRRAGVNLIHNDQPVGLYFQALPRAKNLVFHVRPLGKDRKKTSFGTSFPPLSVRP